MRLRFVTLVMLLLAVVPAFAAARRRSVGSGSTSGVPFTATVKGVVLDAASGLPIAFASVAVGETKTTTTREGTFEMFVSGSGTSTPVVASRSGYNSSTLTINGSGTHDLTFHLQTRPTVTLRYTNGTTVALDDDSIKLGYIVVFGGYVSSTDEDFCKSDGTPLKVNVSAMKKIVGPATLVEQSNCCSRPGAQLQKVHLELKNGEVHDVIFKDSCDGYTVDLLGRNHVSGDGVFAKFNEIAEVTFP